MVVEAVVAGRMNRFGEFHGSQKALDRVTCRLQQPSDLPPLPSAQRQS